MDERTHWETVHRTKAQDGVSWFRPHLETSLALIERVAADRSADIIDVGAGQSTLVDDLLARGYQNITVVDISKIALEATAERLGLAARRLKWMAADITQAVFQPDSYDVWHDRAVFHFLTTQDQRAAYVAKAAQAVRPGANIVISTFGVDGPDRCSGLDVVRYDAKSLHAEFGICFDLVESFAEFHQTPFGTMQQFQYCCLKRK